MNEIAFEKYAVKGAYHWVECFGPLHRLNAYTLARYEMVLAALAEAGVSADTRVLDVGCGDGALSGLIVARLEAQIEGIDVERLSIDLARTEFAKRGLVGRFEAIEGYKYQFEDGVF